jgi:hypothetical protein
MKSATGADVGQRRAGMDLADEFLEVDDVDAAFASGGQGGVPGLTRRRGRMRRVAVLSVVSECLLLMRNECRRENDVCRNKFSHNSI